MFRVFDGKPDASPSQQTLRKTRPGDKNIFNDENIRRIKDRIAPICSRHGIEHMFIFGSQARGEAASGSDVDFFLDKPGAISSILKLIGFRQDLEECLGVDVDIITALEKNSFFGREVLRDMVSIYDYQ